jgi:Holliday junction resolvase RusA-like endonuclease
MTFYFVVPGEPQGKGRPRFVRKTGMSYTPDKTVAYEELVRQRFLATANGERFGDDTEISAHIFAHYAVPKSASKKKKAAMLADEIRPMKKPDTDNIAKIVLDALNGIAYKDDSQVVFLQVEKGYAENGSVVVALVDKEGWRDGWMD